jgi:uncharacterized protein (DUF983 family)
MGKVISWLCLIWNALSFLFGAIVVGVAMIGAFSTSTSPWVIVIMALIFLTGPGLAVATALIGGRIIRNRKLESQVAGVFD